MLKMVILFAVLQLVNVILQTCKMIVTVKGTTFQSALINAITFMVYTVVVVYMVAEFTGNYYLDLLIKVIVVGITNFIGVYISKAIMNKCKKDKLWEIVATIKDNYNPIEIELKDNAISYNISKVSNNDYVFRIYSKNQKQSAVVKNILTKTNAKYFVHEEEVHL